MTTTRAFLALLLDAETRTALGAQIERLRPLGNAVAWVPEANLHITLKFLDRQTDDRLAEVRRALAEGAGDAAPFDLLLHGVGAFPGMERPRILWVGVAEGALAARDLQMRIEAALVQRGFEPDSRPWHPHLTIGRVFDDRRWRRDAGPALREAIALAARTSFGRVRVDRVSLMRSDLSPRGARYTELASTALGGAPSREVTDAG
jgi:RNA 2',3'-cyclic 3'-phosphodiesterase